MYKHPEVVHHMEMANAVSIEKRVVWNKRTRKEQITNKGL